MTETSEPPYLRIAADIRRRILAGELAPGDPVPSTRRICRDWGVALATATKALTTLRSEGLVITRPRAATVVAGRAEPAPPPARPPASAPAPAPEPRAPKPGAPAAAADRELTREGIVRAAIDIADGEGLAALTMRGVAARLGVAAMSPYRHVGGKEELVLLMADEAFGELTYPDPAPEDWRARLELGSRTMWRLYRRHPWLAQLHPLSRPLMLPQLMVHAEWMLSALDGHGLDPVTMFDLHLLLYSYVQGIAVNLERETQAQAATGLTDDQWLDRQAASMRAITTSDRYPVFTRTVTSFSDGYDLDLDDLFEFGLRPLLDGIADIVEGRREPRNTP
ncbi:TetR/AcrR family transcriptional regulator C-terminal domain-containing protein [Streptomyces sp. NPDC088762]|uniref:TetR/AcrR family transcriptional regulator C-terminal domain-containing protein n=1 Tax=Streptomyces sp. NPDC088762 TaxID=3365891 RepID=UPI003819E41E